MSHFSLADGGN